MTTAEQLLASMTEIDKTFVIDNDLRTINIPASINNLGVESDDDVLTVQFQMPGTYCGIDLSKFNIRINYLNAAGEGDYHDVDDAAVQSDGTIRFSWTIGRHAASVVGNVEFNICLKKTDSSGKVLKEFNTTPASLPILKGLEVSEQVISEYNDILEQWRAKLFGVGDTEEARLLAVSQEQQQIISTKSAETLSDIELKGQETLATIPDTYTEVYNMAEEAMRTKADAIVLETEGSVITVDDSSDDYLQNLKICGKTTQVKTTGKNLLPASLLGAVVRNGITYMPEYSSDGQLLCITANGTAGEQSYVTVVSTMSLPEGEYILSGCPSGGSTSAYDVRFNGVNARDYGNGVRFTITSETVQNSISCVIAAGATVHNLKFYPMIRSASVSDSSFEPYSGGCPSPSPAYPQPLDSVVNPTVKIRTNNLFDGTISNCAFSGNNVAVDEAYRGFYLRVTPGKTYTVSRNAITSNRFQIMFTINEPVDNERIYNRVAGDDALSITAIAPHNCEWLLCYLSNSSDDVSNTLYQVEEGVTTTEYEPYIEPQTITLNRTLPGIPVASDGNYTDENGQQWICDEYDFDRGVYIQRTAIDELVTSTNYNDQGLYCRLSSGQSKYDVIAICSHSDKEIYYANGATGAYTTCVLGAKMLPETVTDLASGQAWLDAQKAAGTPVTVGYILTDPIETPLTSEEILAYKALKTNYPNTTVVNDFNAYMELQYIADTRLYVDRTISKLINHAIEARLMQQ